MSVRAWTWNSSFLSFSRRLNTQQIQTLSLSEINISFTSKTLCIVLRPTILIFLLNLFHYYCWQFKNSCVFCEIVYFFRDLFFSILICKIVFEHCFFVIVFCLLNKQICVDDLILIPFVQVCLDFYFREVFVSGERETWIRRTAVIIVSFIGFSSEISTVWNR